MSAPPANNRGTALASGIGEPWVGTDGGTEEAGRESV